MLPILNDFPYNCKSETELENAIRIRLLAPPNVNTVNKQSLWIWWMFQYHNKVWNLFKSQINRLMALAFHKEWVYVRIVVKVECFLLDVNKTDPFISSISWYVIELKEPMALAYECHNLRLGGENSLKRAASRHICKNHQQVLTSCHSLSWPENPIMPMLLPTP